MIQTCIPGRGSEHDLRLQAAVRDFVCSTAPATCRRTGVFTKPHLVVGAPLTMWLVELVHARTGSVPSVERIVAQSRIAAKMLRSGARRAAVIASPRDHSMGCRFQQESRLSAMFGLSRLVIGALPPATSDAGRRQGLWGPSANPPANDAIREPFPLPPSLPPSRPPTSFSRFGPRPPPPPAAPDIAHRHPPHTHTRSSDAFLSHSNAPPPLPAAAAPRNPAQVVSVASIGRLGRRRRARPAAPRHRPPRPRRRGRAAGKRLASNC